MHLPSHHPPTNGNGYVLRGISQVFENAKQLRQAMTPAEKLLWEDLRGNGLHGFRFKAQHPIRYFVADFNGPPSRCHSARLVVELDGSVHDVGDQPDYDANRTSVLNELGLTVIRFQNDEVFCHKTQVLTKISEYLLAATLTGLTPNP